MDCQPDAPKEYLQRFELKQQQRQAAKECYRRILYDPYRPISDGMPFDPVAFRFTSLIHYQTDHYRPNVKSLAWFFGFMVIPMFGYAYIAKRISDTREKRFRSGEVAYADRKWRLIS